MLKSFFQTKFATLALTVGLAFVIIFTARILVQKRTIDREVSRLENQMARVSNENEELSSLIQYLNTPEYKEKEAREKLNLVKEGEHVVVLPSVEEQIAAASAEQNKTNNSKLWFNYFFNVE